MQTKKLRVGYFVHSKVSISESFIFDLIQGLDKEAELTFYSGADELPERIVANQVATGYAGASNRMPYLKFKVGQIMGGKGYAMKGKSFERIAQKRLSKLSGLNRLDVAFIDYCTSGVVLMRALHAREVPFMVHVHGYDITSATSDPYYKSELKVLFELAAGFVCASHYMKRLLILLGCEEAKIEVVRYGIDPDAIQPQSWEKRLEAGPKVIFLGRLTRKKHPIALLHAFRIVKSTIPDSELTIIGDGPLRKEVEARIKSLGLEDSVKLLGALKREQSFPVMNGHWVYAQHSVTALDGDQEGYAISPAEAALMEIPVVSTLHNGIPEHVIDGRTGYLVKEYDYPAMAERIIELLQDPSKSEAMGKAGRRNIIELNNPKIRIESIIELLGQTAANGF